MKAYDPKELLTAMVREKSVTGDTRAVQALVRRWLRERGIEAKSTRAGVIARLGSGLPLLFISHLDTVPPGSGWSFDPFAGDMVKGRLRGRGAVDAKGSAAAMCAAIAALGKDPAFSGSVLLYLSANEEGRRPAAWKTLPELGDFSAAVVGEPTSLNVGVAQRGLMVLRLRVESEQVHAAHGGGGGAALLLAQDLVRLCALPFRKKDPHLGGVTITPVRLTAGVADNLTPPVATATLDVRSIPATPHGDILRRLRGACRHGRLDPVGCDWPPAATPKGHPIRKIALEVTKGREIYGAAAGDWAFLGKTPAVKIGPGDSASSHTPDESVPLSQVRRAVGIYRRLARALSEFDADTGRETPCR